MEVRTPVNNFVIPSRVFVNLLVRKMMIVEMTIVKLMVVVDVVPPMTIVVLLMEVRFLVNQSVTQ
jgi:hypothetical protein